jgi:hypothetical protein
MSKHKDSPTGPSTSYGSYVGSPSDNGNASSDLLVFPVTEEFFVVTAQRADGLPKLCKAVDNRMYFTFDEAAQERDRLNDEYGYECWEVRKVHAVVKGLVTSP